MEDGTIVHVDYELYNNETGDLIETTREAVAKEHEVHQENRSYEPMVCIVGGGQLIPGFEEALAEAKKGKETEVVIAPADAYGEKDPEQIETISIDKLIQSKTLTHSTSALQSPLTADKDNCRILLQAVLELITTILWLVNHSSIRSMLLM